MIQRGFLFLFIATAVLLGGLPGGASQVIMVDGTNQKKDLASIGGDSNPPLDAPGKDQTWRLVRSAGTNGVPSGSAILHTADFDQSDPRLAGLMLRCGSQGIETVIVVVEPFPPRAQPQITLRTQGQESHFVGTIIPTGAGVRLPRDATDLIIGPWHKVRELEIKVVEGDAVINGVVALTGLSEALQSLNAECVQK